MQTNFLTRRRMQRMLGIRYQEVSTFCRRLQRFHNLLLCPMNMTLVRISFQFLCYLRCPYIMWSRVYSGRAFVRLSVPSIHSSSGGRRVCCWAPCGQEISVDSCGRAAGAVLQARRRAAASADRVTSRSDSTQNSELFKGSTSKDSDVKRLLKHFVCYYLKQ